MARKKVVTTEEIEQPDPVPTDSEVTFTTGDDDADPLQELINEAGEDGTVYTVRKVGGSPGSPTGYCAKYSASELSLDVIRDSFGPGKYQIIGRDSSGKYVGAKTVTIIESLKPATPTSAAPAQMTPSDFLMALQAQTAALVQALQPKGIDPLLGELIKGLAARPQPVAPSGPSIMEMLAIMKEMRPEKSGSDDAVGLLLKGLELGKELGGGGDDSMTGLAKTALEMLPALAASQPKPEPGVHPTPQPQPRIPAPAPAAATVAGPVKPEGDDMLMKLNWLRAQTRALVMQASRGKDPTLYAEVMLDNLPGYLSQQEMLTRLKSPTAIDDLAALVPEVAQFRAWFDAFRQACVEMLEAPDDDDGGDDAGGDDVVGIEP